MNMQNIAPVNRIDLLLAFIDFIIALGVCEAAICNFHKELSQRKEIIASSIILFIYQLL